VNSAVEAESGLAREKERTLRIAWMLSAWAPLAGGLALYLGPSTILLADLLRRSSELLAMFLSWLVFLRIARTPGATAEAFPRQQHTASLAVALALLVSSLAVVYSAVAGVREGAEVGWILPGLLLAGAGGGVNCWLWRRNRNLALREPGPLIAAQWRFYRTKTMIDACVIATLIGGAAGRDLGVSAWVDAAGSCIIALFMLHTARHIGRAGLAGLRVEPVFEDG